MKTETLEALLIDRALGALSPEVAELLEDHLLQNPDAARRADRLAATVQLARAAVAGPKESTGQPPPLDRARKALRAQRRQAFVWELSKLAACLLLGLTVGLVSRTGGSSAGGPQIAAAAGRQPSAAGAAQDVGTRSRFWSLANLAPGKPEPTAAGDGLGNRYRLHWDSPVKLPHLEENL